MSDFIIYNAARERIGILQNEESVQWLENYQSPGEVKIVAHATRDNLTMLTDGNRIYYQDSDCVARISHSDITKSGSEELITVRADLTAELLSDRVVMQKNTVTNIEAAMYAVYSANRRSMPMDVGTSHGYTESTTMEITWNSVLDALLKLAEISGLGFRVLFDPETGAETLTVYKGTDRSRDTYPGYVGYFGTDVGNIQNVTVTSGTTDYKNVAIVAGAGEGTDRTVRTVELGTFAGEYRREMYVDARDLQPDGKTAAQYNALLDARGRAKLAEQLKDFSVTCDIVQANIIYGTDYFLGDRMPIKLPEYGIYTSARISSVITVCEKEGDRIVALLNDFETKGDS